MDTALAEAGALQQTEAASKPTLSPKVTSLQVQTAESFLERAFPPKEPLVDGLLYRRDIVCFAGRRRHGKTSINGGLATALTLPESDFLGYPIQRAVRVLVFFLEDDPGELQEKLRKLMAGRDHGGRLAIYTREDFQREGIQVALDDKHNPKFEERINLICQNHRPDLIILDNLAHLIGANYNHAPTIHSVGNFAFELTAAFNAAVIIAAHPKKKSKEVNVGGLGRSGGTASLRVDPEGFFEEVMGSSHFVNSCGSLWGIERDMKTNHTDFLGGTQRYTGEQALVTLEKGEDERFYIVDEIDANLLHAKNTPSREKAWAMLPDSFAYSEGERIVESVMKASAYRDWLVHAVRLKVLLKDDRQYRKAKGQPSGTGGK